MSSHDGEVSIYINDSEIKDAINNLDKYQTAFDKFDTSDFTVEIDGVQTSVKKLINDINKGANFDGFEKSLKQGKDILESFANAGADNIPALENLSNAINSTKSNAEKLTKPIKDDTKEVKNFNNEAKKTANDGLLNMADGFKNLEVAGIKVSTLLKGFTVTAVAKKLYDSGKTSIETAAQFEQLATSFNVMTGSAAAGKELTNSLIELAAKTPMTTEGLARATQTLLSFGESTNNIIDDLRILGDISGGDEQRFQSLALAFAQVGSTGRLTGQDLLQMVNQGFNPLQAISEKTGKSMTTLKKEMGEGKISFEMVKQAMIDATSEGGRFYGLMEEQSQTLSGRLSTLSDTWQQVGKSIGDKFLPVAKTAVDAMNKIGVATQNTIKWLESEKSTLAGLKKEWDKYWASKRKAKGMVFEVDANWLKKQRENGIFAKNIDNTPIKSNGNGFTSSVGESDTEKRAKRIKDAFEKAQDEAQKAEKAFKLALYQSNGNITPAVEQARLKMLETKKAVDDVQKAFENLTATGKIPFEQLNFNIEEARQKVLNLASSPVVNLEALREAQTEYNNLKLKLDEVNNAANGAYTQLTNQQSQLAAQLRDAFATVDFDKDQLQTLITNYQSVSEQIKNIDKSMSDAMGKNWDDVSKNISSALGSTLVSALQGGQNALQAFSSIATSLLQKVLDKMLEMAIITPILNSLTGGSGGTLFSGLSGVFSKHANGNIFQNGNVIPFAKGGVVDRPTIFPMANGGTGLMGEAGAEAVMPLRRMSNGRLGVEAENTSGNAVNVNIYNQAGASVETRKRDDGSMDIFIRKVNEALSSERTSSGFRSAYAREDKRGVQAV